MIDAQATFKICVFGPPKVGKTSLTNRFLTGMFDMDSKSTIGASIYVKYLEVNNLKVALQIWDFGGEDKFQFLLPVYAFGSNAAVYMFDLTREETLGPIQTWLKFFREGLKDDSDNVPIYLVGGKLDLADQRQVNTEKANKEIENYNLTDYLECSSKTGENVNLIFETMTENILEKIGHLG